MTGGARCLHGPWRSSQRPLWRGSHRARRGRRRDPRSSSSREWLRLWPIGRLAGVVPDGGDESGGCSFEAGSCKGGELAMDGNGCGEFGDGVRCVHVARILFWAVGFCGNGNPCPEPVGERFGAAREWHRGTRGAGFDGCAFTVTVAVAPATVGVTVVELLKAEKSGPPRARGGGWRKEPVHSDLAFFLMASHRQSTVALRTNLQVLDRDAL